MRRRWPLLVACGRDLRKPHLHAGMSGLHCENGWPQAGDGGIRTLSCLTNLEELDVSQTGTADMGLTILPHLRCLRRLSLASCPISHRGVSALRLHA